MVVFAVIVAFPVVVDVNVFIESLRAFRRAGSTEMDGSMDRLVDGSGGRCVDRALGMLSLLFSLLLFVLLLLS